MHLTTVWQFNPYRVDLGRGTFDITSVNRKTDHELPLNKQRPLCTLDFAPKQSKQKIWKIKGKVGNSKGGGKKVNIFWKSDYRTPCCV